MLAQLFIWSHSPWFAALWACLAVAAARFAPLPASYQPWLLFRFAAYGLARRVLHDTDSAAYQRFAGLLSCAVLLVPALLLYWLLRQLSDWPFLLDAVLLYFCLDAGAIPQQVRQLDASLQKNQLSLARQQLSSWVLRDTQHLSEMGLIKAALDSLILRYATQWFGILCCFCLFGGLATLALRILLELHYAWNTKLPRYVQYGLWLRQTLVVVLLPPLYLFSLILALQVGWRASLRLYQQHDDRSWPKPQRFLLCVWSQTLQRQTGGPAMYQGVKVRRARLGPDTPPQRIDLANAIRYVSTQQNAVWLLGLLLVVGLCS